MITVRKTLRFGPGRYGQRLVSGNSAPPAATGPRVPRIARLMALAIRFDRLLRDGTVRDLSELARLARVTQPRATQILNLTLLAPDIQEQLLHYNGVRTGREWLHERSLRAIAATADWFEQRRRWLELSRHAGLASDLRRGRVLFASDEAASSPNLHRRR